MANHYEKTDEGDIAKVVVTKNERTTLSSFLAKVMAKPFVVFFFEKRLTVLGSAMFQRWHCKYPRTD